MRVLVVEDNPDMGPYLEQGLREHGFAVDLVTDGNHALDYAATGVYDLLILDRMLPGRDGLDILRRLRAGGCSDAGHLPDGEKCGERPGGRARCRCG